MSLGLSASVVPSLRFRVWGPGLGPVLQDHGDTPIIVKDSAGDLAAWRHGIHTYIYIYIYDPSSLNRSRSGPFRKDAS